MVTLNAVMPRASHSRFRQSKQHFKSHFNVFWLIEDITPCCCEFVCCLTHVKWLNQKNSVLLALYVFQMLPGFSSLFNSRFLGYVFFNPSQLHDFLCCRYWRMCFGWTHLPLWSGLWQHHWILSLCGPLWNWLSKNFWWSELSRYKNGGFFSIFMMLRIWPLFESFKLCQETPKARCQVKGREWGAMKQWDFSFSWELKPEPQFPRFISWVSWCTLI
jgi:hypothetical protein